MSDRKANVRHGQIVECATHKRKRQWKSRVAKPTNNCPVCWMVYLSDVTDTLLYKEDIEAIIGFSNTFTKIIKPSSIEYNEVAKDE